ncbi:hypothetical protein QUF72_10160 [Desulfobacterales bacterium HSG2]|nr:hypothetical protein [Desulfobacterales bacterium HSG2]
MSNSRNFTDHKDIHFEKLINKFDLTNTDALRSYFNSICSAFENDIGILTDVIKSQKQLIEYNAIYNAFVLEHISEEDFMEESEHYSYTPKDTDANELVDKLSCVLKYTGIKFSSSELAEIFQCKHENIEKALRKLPKDILNLTEQQSYG